MKTYSLLAFLSESINHILDHDEDYCFKSLNSGHGLPQINQTSISKIAIPIIQRDYVQGRWQYKELLEGFVAKLFDYLESEKLLKLDFIYGSLDRLNGNIFLPLDGQQRLTTLYLLHWYIIKKEASKEEFINRYRPLLSKFCYETRDTSRRFFKEMVDFNFEGNPKENIIQAYWFNDHFALDPTVSAALNTLETIHEVYSRSSFKGTLHEKLIKNHIVFYILPMDQFKLTDDLYIKLNARGKALSSFENFKADIIGFLKLPDLIVDGMNKQESLKRFDSLASKFDNDWTNLFWQKAKADYSKEKSIDRYFFRFIHRLLINNYLLNYSGSEINKDPIYKELLNKEATLKYSNFELYQQNKLIDDAFLNQLETLLDFYLINIKHIGKYVAPIWESNFEWSIYDESYSMNHRMIFDAINHFILNNSNLPFDEVFFRDWMRIVWNLISDPDNRSIEANKTAMTVVREIAKFSHNINLELVSGQLDAYIESLTNIYKEQLIEEKLKARLMGSEDGVDWKKYIYESESHNLFKGNIGFLLQDIQAPIHLKTRYSVTRQLFNDSGAKECLKNEKYSLIRYVISQIDNWESLEKFNFSNGEVNWRTNLRRSKPLKDILVRLIDLTPLDEILKDMENAIKQPSKIQSSNVKQSIAHQNLYLDNRFHEWMQADGVNKIRWKEAHYYAIRPNAWYSKVMIDGFRNEVITFLIHHFQIEDVKNRCGKSDYFWDEKFSYSKKVDNDTVTFQFDIHNKLQVGLWGDLNPHIGNVVKKTDGWIEVHTFNLDKITSVDEIDSYLRKMKEDIAACSDSLITKTFFNPIKNLC